MLWLTGEMQHGGYDRGDLMGWSNRGDPTGVICQGWSDSGCSKRGVLTGICHPFPQRSHAIFLSWVSATYSYSTLRIQSCNPLYFCCTTLESLAKSPFPTIKENSLFMPATLSEKTQVLSGFSWMVNIYSFLKDLDPFLIALVH